MKILFASPRANTVVGVIGTYCMNALAGLGHEVLDFDFRRKPFDDGLLAPVKAAVRKLIPAAPSPFSLPAVQAGIDASLNRRIMEIAGKFKPDVFLALLGENIGAQTLAQLRQQGILTVNWILDTLLLPHRLSFVREIAPYYDTVFIIDSPEILRRFPFDCRRVESLCLGFDPTVHSPGERESGRFSGDVAFVGSVTEPRHEFLSQLAGFGLNIWGRWEREDGRLKGCYRGKDLYGDDAARIFRSSRIVLDCHGLFGSEKLLYNVSPRAFEVPACKGFLLTNDSLQIRELYRVGEEIAVYRDMDDLKKMLRYYLDHEDERLSMAEAAWRRAQEYTYANRFKRMFEIIGKER